MKRTTTLAVAIAGSLVSGWTLDGTAQQQPVCLHAAGETPANAARRQEAIRVIRAINSAQATSFAVNRTYHNFRELTDLGLPPRPPGFATQLTVEASTYALLLKDTADPCRYTLFSDQEGLIYAGSPLQ
jgi:hypothetical protein